MSKREKNWKAPSSLFPDFFWKIFSPFRHAPLVTHGGNIFIVLLPPPLFCKGKKPRVFSHTLFCMMRIYQRNLPFPLHKTMILSFPLLKCVGRNMATAGGIAPAAAAGGREEYLVGRKCMAFSILTGMSPPFAQINRSA